ncbi:MAG: arsenic resistance N-acetyltransferase ArsN2 [Kofleriaceae bacterium]
MLSNLIMQIERTNPTDEIKALLVANGLPIDDLDDPDISLFAAHDGAALAGVVGLQWLEGAALLRSLAVEPSLRTNGVGAQLCAIATHEAETRGRSELWLLTTSARDYFARRGFQVVARDLVPPAVRSTAQFASLCPASAVVMRRTK